MPDSSESDGAPEAGSGGARPVPEPGDDFRQGVALQAAGDDVAAIAAFRRTLVRLPDFVGAWNNLGVALTGRGRLPAAFVALRRAIAAHPRGSEGWNNLAN